MYVSVLSSRYVDRPLVLVIEGGNFLVCYFEPRFVDIPFSCLAPLAHNCFIQSEKFGADLFKTIAAGAPHTEVSVEFSCVLDLTQAITFNKMLPILLTGAHGEQAHRSVKVRVQFIVDNGPANPDHERANSDRHAIVLDALNAWASR